MWHARIAQGCLTRWISYMLREIPLLGMIFVFIQDYPPREQSVTQGLQYVYQKEIVDFDSYVFSLPRIILFLHGT
jgi:hypothetical protein